MSARSIFIALAVLFVSAPSVRAEIDVSPAPEEKSLLLKKQDASDARNQTIIIYNEGLPMPQSYPGGCFNCPSVNNGNFIMRNKPIRSFGQGYYYDGNRVYIVPK